ncbi:MAG: IclR family transcriptional regulator [Nocardioides sp.]|nr:IclR family transcriptional regulator [Nocardioides sp.]
MSALDTELLEHREARPGVVTRVTQILDVFMWGSEFMGLDDITSVTGLPRSTAFRILNQLVELDWLEHSNRGYRLGARTQGMGGRGTDHVDLRSAAAPIINDLHLNTGAVAHLGVLEGGTVHYLDKVGGAAAASVPSRVGGRHPADRTVSGRALLACLVPEDVDTLLGVSSVRHRKEVDLVALHSELDRIRKGRGIAVVPADRCVMGITALAAPVRGPHGVVGTISLAGRDLPPLQAVAPMVTAAARMTAQALFPQHASPMSGRGDGRLRAVTRHATGA